MVSVYAQINFIALASKMAGILLFFGSMSSATCSNDTPDSNSDSDNSEAASSFKKSCTVQHAKAADNCKKWEKQFTC